MNAPYTRDIPSTTDTLGESLYLLRLNGSLYCQSDLSAPWGIEMPPLAGKMMFHIVVHGECWLSVPGNPVVHLKPGELTLVPRGEGHSIASSNSVDCVNLFDIPVTNLSERFEYMRYGGEGDKTLLTCGVVSFDHVAGRKLIEQLPPMIHIKNSDAELNESIKHSIALMATEAQSLRTGGETIMAHLADIIVIHAIRYWIEKAPEAQKGWLGALKDPKVGKALAAIHAQPECAWTVDNLAQTAGMSRSGFSARFSEIIGTSVKQYLTEWRMNLARAKIMTTSISLGELAEELGYQSEAAFSRAYKRVMGESPVRHIS